MFLQTKAKDLDLTNLSQRIMINLLNLINEVELPLPKEQKFNLIVKIVLFFTRKIKIKSVCENCFIRRSK